MNAKIVSFLKRLISPKTILGSIIGMLITFVSGVLMIYAIGIILGHEKTAFQLAIIGLIAVITIILWYGTFGIIRAFQRYKDDLRLLSNNGEKV